MKKIDSFTVNHLKLLKGVYVSRVDTVGNESVITYDIRMKAPNKEEVMDTATVHTIEHIGATYLRNDEKYADKVIYFGPMGCRTGFYLILKGNETSKSVALGVVKNMFEYIRKYVGKIPGADPRSCGNYTDMDLSQAKLEAEKYISEVLNNSTDANFNYPK